MKPAFDQFFTKPGVARECWARLEHLLDEWQRQWFFIEPGAGDGAFYDLMPPHRRIGIDIAPRRPEFVKHDFLSLDYAPTLRSSAVVVGNPPFGHRGRMAIAFFRRAAQMADTIAFIVPVIFRKHAVHKQLPGDFRWIHAMPLPPDAFWTEASPDYSVNTEFQVWTRLPSAHADMRLFQPPPTRHRDFELYQYNNTPEAQKVFAKDFDFAVPCQGWQDYSRRETAQAQCERSKQWMLIKASSDDAYMRLYAGIDYEALARRNTTSVPGFRKGDLVTAYTALWG